MKQILLFSGGLDSSTLLYYLQKQGDEVTALWFDYGQKNAERERKAARIIAAIAKCKLLEFNITDVFRFSRSAILAGSNTLITMVEKKGEDVHFRHADTEVEFRNGVLLAMGVSIARQIYPAEQQVCLAYGATKSICGYPDCSAVFVKSINNLAAVYCGSKVRVHAPFIQWGKDQVYQAAQDLGVPIAATWSCYEGGIEACGVCPACLDRRILEET